jgi:hypothetical protein
MMRRRFHRSTNTPAAGPTKIAGIAAASSTPLTAAGAQDCPFAMTVPIQRTTVVLKT